jgi:hypothetical protein
LSSTTEQKRGQALAIFSISLSAVMMMAALAFDGGAMMLERRDQQNAADAAAIAAARYIKTDTVKAKVAALSVATANGFTDGVNSASVSINIPPTAGSFKDLAGYVEVEIGSTRPSIFAGIMGVASWPVSARAVGADLNTAGGSWSIFALDPTSCDAMLLSGNGTIIANGNIQVNSNCSTGALRRQGGSNITLAIENGACNVVGDIKDGGGLGVIDCVQNEGAPYVEDPLRFLPPPSVPLTPLGAVQVSGSQPIPPGCPGSADPATLVVPAVCQFPSSYAGTTWRLYPGLYPGGIKLQGGTFYLEPGIYYLAGGGLDFTGNSTTTFTVDANGSTGPAGGVMFYNTQIEGSPVGPVIINGASAEINLWPYDDFKSPYDAILIFQDRTINMDGDDLIINGSDSDMILRGTIYVPAGNVKINGGAGVLTMDQIIGWTYTTNGAPGTQFLALREKAFIVHLRAAGLVE